MTSEEAFSLGLVVGGAAAVIGAVLISQTRPQRVAVGAKATTIEWSGCELSVTHEAVGRGALALWEGAEEPGELGARWEDLVFPGA